uniref:mRNA end processing factor n=1 Tax=Amorphochlora amoebiformis TaxID=1561963 RepID=A0A0H5BKS9_9EUKA|nr:mRNA end processing factor [Amorphochlora amoebiformis]
MSFKIETLFLGGVREVGKSCFLYKILSYKILIDCGIIRSDVSLTNFPDFLKIKYINKPIILLISHYHLDHSGSIAYLLNYTLKKLIIISNYLTKYMFYVNFKEFTTINRNSFRLLECHEDLEIILELFESIYKDHLHINNKSTNIKTLSIKFINAGHAYGANMISILLGNLKLLYSGDLSIFADTELIGATNESYNIDLLFLDSTVGIKNNLNFKVMKRKLSFLLKKYFKQKKSIIFPFITIKNLKNILLLIHTISISSINEFYESMVFLNTKKEDLLKMLNYNKEIIPKLKKIHFYLDKNIDSLINTSNVFNFPSIIFFAISSISSVKPVHNKSSPIFITFLTEYFPEFPSNCGKIMLSLKNVNYQLFSYVKYLFFSYHPSFQDISEIITYYDLEYYFVIHSNARNSSILVGFLKMVRKIYKHSLLIINPNINSIFKKFYNIKKNQQGILSFLIKSTKQNTRPHILSSLNSHVINYQIIQKILIIKYNFFFSTSSILFYINPIYKNDIFTSLLVKIENTLIKPLIEQ